jgi:ribose 5-phosphate isomerase B
MRIALGSDHAGYDLKVHLASALQGWGYEIVDLGTDNGIDSVDYPDFAAAVGHYVASGDADLGVLVCGTGIGVAIAANKVPGVRAATVHDVTSAHLAREHNHANVLCLGSRLLGPVVAEEAVRAWLDAVPGTGRHQQRIDKITELDSLLVEHER